MFWKDKERHGHIYMWQLERVEDAHRDSVNSSRSLPESSKNIETTSETNSGLLSSCNCCSWVNCWSKTSCHHPYHCQVPCIFTFVVIQSGSYFTQKPTQDTKPKRKIPATHTHKNQKTKETIIYYDPQNPGLSSPSQYQISTPQSEQ